MILMDTELSRLQYTELFVILPFFTKYTEASGEFLSLSITTTNIP